MCFSSKLSHVGLITVYAKRGRFFKKFSADLTRVVLVFSFFFFFLIVTGLS